MSQNPFSDLFQTSENFQKPTSFHSSQVSNTSLNILNKISAISIKNLSKNNSFDLNDFSFLHDGRQNQVGLGSFVKEDLHLKENQENRVPNANIGLNYEKPERDPGEIEHQMIEKSFLIGDKPTKSERNINKEPLALPNTQELVDEEPEFKIKSLGKQNQSLESKKQEPIEKEFQKSKRQKPEPRKMIETSFFSTSRESFDFLVKDWGDYFFDETPKKLNIDEDYRHIIIRTVYQCYSYPEFANLVIWGSEKKYGVIDCFLDYQLLKQTAIETALKETKNKPKAEIFQILAEILDYLSQNPVDLLHSFDLAFDAVRLKILGKTKRRVITRIHDFPNVCSLQEIKSNIIGDFIAIKGIVLKISPVKLLTKSMKFICLECHRTFLKKFLDGIYICPTSCENAPKCKSKTFQPEKSTAQTILYQRIKLQEIDEESGSGRVPRSLDCELTDNLVNCLISGETVILTGVLKTEALEENKGGGGGKKNQQGLFNMYLDVNCLVNGKEIGKTLNPEAIAANEEEFTEEDLRIFESLLPLAQTRRLFPLLIKSFCPSIYGHEIVKAGLLLAIVGGSSEHFEKKQRPEKYINKKEPNFRKDCHVLLIGDPGLGKSQLLKYVANIAPRSVYVCGKSSSTVGLTVAVQKDSSGEGTLEAGALVLSDQGVCCIDEFDKMDKEHLALLESMEQQTVSIAKSGVLCSLCTRTSIIASANPQGGNYNKQKNIKDNIKISNAILSRFDLIFLMLDEPDPKRDQKLSEHVMRLHNHKKRRRSEFENGNFHNPFAQNNFSDNLSQLHINFDDYVYGKNNQSGLRKSFEQNGEPFHCLDDQFIGNHYQSLSERLNKICEGIGKTLQTYVLRKYISYVKKNVSPWFKK